MNLSDITAKAWILALFIRDDGQRILLGDGWYDFKDSLQHFQPDNIANDVVELQGADGQLLAGQVRRSGTQEFSGYVGDAATPQATVETRRRDFLGFFQVRHKYKVVYIFPDGSAIQRQRGYLVEPATVQEMWQFFPEYHVALSFENVPYYEYAEDNDGNEIYAHTLNLTALTKSLRTGTTIVMTDVSSAYSGMLSWGAYGNTIQDSTPTPTSPVVVRKVAGLQTVTVVRTGEGGSTRTFSLGRNLFDNTQTPVVSLTLATESAIDTGIRVTCGGNGNYAAVVYKIMPTSEYIGETITLHANLSASASNLAYADFVLCDADGGNRQGVGTGLSTSGTTSYTISSFDSTRPFLAIRLYANWGGTAVLGDYCDYTNLQVEVGSATSYAPFFTPIELNKVGAAQDSILGSSGTWTLTKTTKKVIFDGTENWSGSTYNGVFRAQITISDISSIAQSSSFAGFSNFFHKDTRVFGSAIQAGMFCQYTGTNDIYWAAPASVTTLAQWRAWLKSNPTSLYYALNNASATTITNTNLINQLDSVQSVNLYPPDTTITSTPKGQNLGAQNAVQYLTNANEKTINITGTDNTHPTWVVTGPADHPAIKNGTNGLEMKYDATLASGQVLIVDMANKTAMVGSTNVISYISGDWIQIRPGENIIAFTTSNQSGTSKLEWNGVVG